jgi:hypothetical protein
MFDLHDVIHRHDAAWSRSRPRLRALYDAVGRPTDLCFDDWEMIFRCLETFRPAWIIELGRCTGNSTMLFLDHCDRHDAALTSLDRENNHFTATLEKMRGIGVPPPASLAAADILSMDILDWTPPADAPAGPTVLFVDAHGDALGCHVVDTLVPALRRRGFPLLVIAHDIVDLRYETIAPTKFDLRHRWRDLASPFSEIVQLAALFDEFGVQSAAEARKMVTGRDTAIADGVGFCGVFVTCEVPPLIATPAARKPAGKRALASSSRS